MTFKKPAHKDTVNPPGQIVNSVSVPETHRSKTIGGIVDRVMRSEAPPIKKKLTFEEWWDSRLLSWRNHYCHDKEATELIWKTAQENK